METLLLKLKNVNSYDEFIKICEQGRKQGFIYKCPLFIGECDKLDKIDKFTNENLKLWRFFDFKKDTKCSGSHKCVDFDSICYWSSITTFKIKEPNVDFNMYAVKINFSFNILNYENLLKHRKNIYIKNFDGKFLQKENLDDWMFSVIDKLENFIFKEKSFNEISYWYTYQLERDCTVFAIKKKTFELEKIKKEIELEKIKKEIELEKNKKEIELEKNKKEIENKFTLLLEKNKKEIENKFTLLLEKNKKEIEKKYVYLEKKIDKNYLYLEHNISIINGNFKFLKEEAIHKLNQEFKKIESENLILKKELKDAIELLSNATIVME